jgi:hypothetical protein
MKPSDIFYRIGENVPGWVMFFIIIVPSFSYAILLPDTTYYMLGIMFDLWFPILESFWGYVIVVGILMIPFVNVVFFGLLLLQSAIVVLKFLFGSYEPSLHGVITMIPALMVVVVGLIALNSRN